MQMTDQEHLAYLQQQIQDSIERVRHRIVEAKELLGQYNENLDAVSLELLRSAATQEEVA